MIFESRDQIIGGALAALFTLAIAIGFNACSDVNFQEVVRDSSNSPLGGNSMGPQDQGGMPPVPPADGVISGPVVCNPFDPNNNSQCLPGLYGNLYYLSEADIKNPPQKVAKYIERGIPVDVNVLLSQLNVPDTPWDRGFHMADGELLKNKMGEVLYEYFALDLVTYFRLGDNDPEGYYLLATRTDDGSMIYADNDKDGIFEEHLLDNDGVHAPKTSCAFRAIQLKHGQSLPLRIQYYQGPRVKVMLSMYWRRANDLKDTSCDLNSMSLVPATSFSIQR